MDLAKKDDVLLSHLSVDELKKLHDRAAKVLAKVKTLLPPNGPARMAKLGKLFASHQISYALGSASEAKYLKSQGLPVEAVAPEEGTVAWINHLMISSRSEHIDLGYELLQEMLEPKTQKDLADTTRSNPVNPGATFLLSQGLKLPFNFQENEKNLNHSHFVQNVPGGKHIAIFWSEVRPQINEQ